MNRLLNAGIVLLALISIAAIFIEPKVIWAYAIIAAFTYAADWLKKRRQSQ